MKKQNISNDFLIARLTMNESNRDILQGIANHDQQSFRLLFDLFSSRLIHFSYSMLKNRETAIEIVDEVFVQFWKNSAHAISIQNINMYLHTAVKNCALNYLSRKSREQKTDPIDIINTQQASEQDPEQQMISAELFQKIDQAVNELPPRCKMIFQLVREYGLKYKEVADLLHLSINTVDAQMVIAVKRISEKLGNQLGRRIDSTTHKVVLAR